MRKGNHICFQSKFVNLTKTLEKLVTHPWRSVDQLILFYKRGATVCAKICGNHYRGGPLVQGVIEVPCQVTVCMPGSVVYHLLLSRYETILRNFYIEPKEEEIMGIFLTMTNDPVRKAEPHQQN